MNEFLATVLIMSAVSPVSPALGKGKGKGKGKPAIAADSFRRALTMHGSEDLPGDRAVQRPSLVMLLLGYCALPANAASASASPDAGGSVFQVMLGLGLVLAVIAGSAWLLKHFGGMPKGSSSAIRVIGGSAVGQRERVVLVEIADTWLVIGVAPGQVTALHSMPKGENTAGADRAIGGSEKDTRFSAWFRQVMEKHNPKSGN